MRAPLRVQRTTPPIKFLAQRTQADEKVLSDLIETGWALIERELHQSQPDPEAAALTGSLHKSTRDTERRRTHGAPPETALERAEKALGRETYDVPSQLEPLAELARQLTEEEFKTALRGLPSEEEQRTRAQADLRESQAQETWTALLLKHGDAETARADPTWDAIDQLATASIMLADLTHERWEKQRALGRAALRKSAQYHTEDNLTPTPTRLSLLYSRATSKGGLKGADVNYAHGQKVEVQDATGRWRAATVDDIDPKKGTVKVLRTDGQKRTVTYPFTIRSIAEANPSLDTELEKSYNKGMDTFIPRFNVTLPKESTSHRIEDALEPITVEMNDLALPVNQETWENNLTHMRQNRDGLNSICHELAGKSFRPNATRDCAQILFVEQGLSPRRINTKSGEPSVDQPTLMTLAAEGSELAGAITRAREAQSKLSQLEAWKPHAEAGLVKTTWDSLGTPHGRYTSAEPNLQNRIREIRETIEAPPGHHLQSFDLGQAEYVTWASLSGDETLAKAFADGSDFHRTMYEELRKAAPDVNLHHPDPRQAGKTVNFALLYLMQANVLAQQLGLPGEEGARLIKAYGERAPTAIQYRDRFLEHFGRTGTTETKFGRRRELTVPSARPLNRAERHEANKTAWNHLVAGTAAEILKIYQVRSHTRLRKAGLDTDDVRIALQMHDELIFLVKDQHREKVSTIVNEVFHESIPGFLPFRIDHRIGQTWLEISK